jgi:hypothetical protein
MPDRGKIHQRLRELALTKYQMHELTEAWLQKINSDFRRDDVPPKQRPWLAWKEWAKHAGQPLPLSDDVAKKIFRWFENHTKAGVQYIGPMYTGVFYYDSCFWPVFVPIVFGRVQLRAWDYLKTMPDAVMKQLWREPTEVKSYADHWVNCIDYAFGINDLRTRKNFNEFTQQLLESADQEMNAAISLLLVEDRPNPKAIERATMATEMFLKMFLAAKAGLTEDEAKHKIRHDLEEALRRCVAADNESELLTIQSSLDVFPGINDRYKGTDQPLGVLWRGYEIAQFTGTTVCRSLTGRDTRKTLRTRF